MDLLGIPEIKKKRVGTFEWEQGNRKRNRQETVYDNDKSYPGK